MVVTFSSYIFPKIIKLHRYKYIINILYNFEFQIIRLKFYNEIIHKLIRMYSKKIKSLLEELFTCPICLDILKDPATTKCGHSFCLGCVKMNKYECAVCRRKIESNLSINYMIKKAIDSLQNMSEEEFDKKFNDKNNGINNVNTETPLFKIKRCDEKILQTEVKPKRINPNYTMRENYIDRENYFAKSENVNKFRTKRLRSQIDCFNEIDRNYLYQIGLINMNNNVHQRNYVNSQIQSQNLECNRNLFNNNIDYDSYENNQIEYKYLYPDRDNQPIHKLTTRVIDNYLDEVLNKFQNENPRNSYDIGENQMMNYNDSRNTIDSTTNFNDDHNLITPIHNQINNVNINIYNIQPDYSTNQLNNNEYIQTTANSNNQLNYNSYQVISKRFKYK